MVREIDYLQIKLLKASNKLAKIPTSVIIEEEKKHQHQSSFYGDYMSHWPKVRSY